MLRPAQMLGDIWTSFRGLEPRKREQAPALHRNVPPKFGVRRLAAALRFQEIKGTLFMPHSDLKPPYGLLIGGVFFLFLAVGGTCTGKARALFGHVVYRDEEPKRFWGLIASHYLVGLFLIGHFLYKVYFSG